MEGMAISSKLGYLVTTDQTFSKKSVSGERRQSGDREVGTIGKRTFDRVTEAFYREVAKKKNRCLLIHLLRNYS